MLRKSLHDPVLSLQIEAEERDSARREIVEPLLNLFGATGGSQQLASALDYSALSEYNTAS
jgi:hypothetical protein